MTTRLPPPTVQCQAAVYVNAFFESLSSIRWWRRCNLHLPYNVMLQCMWIHSWRVFHLSHDDDDATSAYRTMHCCSVCECTRRESFIYHMMTTMRHPSSVQCIPVVYVNALEECPSSITWWWRCDFHLVYTSILQSMWMHSRRVFHLSPDDDDATSI